MLTVIIGVVALAGGFAGGFLYRKKVSEKEISSAEEEGRRIVNEAIRNAESKKKEALLEAKEEILKSRTDYEKEEKSRRADLQRQENRLQQIILVPKSLLSYLLPLLYSYQDVLAVFLQYF